MRENESEKVTTVKLRNVSPDFFPHSIWEYQSIGLENSHVLFLPRRQPLSIINNWLTQHVLTSLFRCYVQCLFTGSAVADWGASPMASCPFFHFTFRVLTTHNGFCSVDQIRLTLEVVVSIENRKNTGRIILEGLGKNIRRARFSSQCHRLDFYTRTY